MKNKHLSVLLSLVLAMTASPLNAQMDTSIGQAGVDEEANYHPEQEPRAEEAANRVSAENVEYHPFHDGASPFKTLENWLEDFNIIRNDITYDKCLDYVRIGSCLSIVPGGPSGTQLKLTPYVRYYGPFQKVEAVPEPFRTGYLPKLAVQPIKELALDEYYSKFIPEVALHQYKFGMQNAADYLNTTLDLGMNPGPFPTQLPQNVIDAAADAIKEHGEPMGVSMGAGNGYIQSEYHLMFGDTSFYIAMKPPNEIPPDLEEVAGVPFKGWCHNMKIPTLWYSEFPDNRYISRVPQVSAVYFPTEMALLKSNPLTCLNFNRTGNNGLTPHEIADIDRVGGGAVTGAPCQGLNQGLWLPLTTKLHTTYQTTAAALSFTKSKIGYQTSPQTFYDIDPKTDKVQWLKNDRMDGFDEGPDSDGIEQNKEVKKCSKEGGIEKFVLDYKKGNLKISPGEGYDDWNVIAHWRKIRCCPLGGVPVWLKPEYRGTESYFPQTE
jgi:hypothetical protein